MAPVAAEEQPKVVEETVEVEAETTALTTSGRVRRTIQKFGFDEAKDGDEEEEFQPPVGNGVKVSELEVVAERIAALNKKDAEVLKSLYSIMYGRRFQLKNIKAIKEHILEFTGIPDADDKTQAQLMQKIGRWKRTFLVEIIDLLGVNRSKKSFDEENKVGDKEGLMQRLIDWLLEPKETGAKPKAARKKTKAKTTTAKKSPKAAAGTKRKSPSSAKTPAKKAKTAKAKKSAPEEEESTESEPEEESDDDKGNDSSSDFDEAKSGSNNKSKRKATSKQSKQDDEDSEPDNNESEAKTASSGLNAAVREKVKSIIASGNAEELTLKKIVRQVSEELGEDFSSQKAAIKDFITQL
ncbi:hypothetical protein Poli38472_003569 [Pythium oligandrum]|uniref:DEK-C domain-containing protein n=1 Tax=Pythium oligandrum TaxID=41045 RepID=A0A8K1FM10_PYTOL|nr:hypothetical protein Poli38472_003569 [Pythium oligandrum]|eukprot:TMW65804.1 hypothetical protein Poli38472_003569 [Pythium oligandrum]